MEIFVNGSEVEVQVNGEKQDALFLSDLVDDYLDSITDIDGKVESEHKDQVNALLRELEKSIELINDAT